MLRVSVKDESSVIALEVEGRLAGPWVAELEHCWQQQAVRGKPVAVRLCAVSYIDDAGRKLLSRMFMGGAKLQGNGCMVRAIVAGITTQGKK